MEKYYLIVASKRDIIPDGASLSSIGLTIVGGNGVLEYLIFLKRMILNTVKALTKFALQVLEQM